MEEDKLDKVVRYVLGEEDLGLKPLPERMTALEEGIKSIQQQQEKVLNKINELGEVKKKKYTVQERALSVLSLIFLGFLGFKFPTLQEFIVNLFKASKAK